jgi:uncharacterized protein
MNDRVLQPPPSVLGRGWGFEVRREAGRIVASAEEESVREAIRIILSTARGERLMRPDFGCNLHELAFAPNDSVTEAQAEFEVREALEAWEPRIDIVDVQARAGGDFGEWLLIEIEYRVRSTDNRFNLVYPFYLDRPMA